MDVLVKGYARIRNIFPKQRKYAFKRGDTSFCGKEAAVPHVLSSVFLFFQKGNCTLSERARAAEFAFSFQIRLPKETLPAYADQPGDYGTVCLITL